MDIVELLFARGARACFMPTLGARVCFGANAAKRVRLSP